MIPSPACGGGLGWGARPSSLLHLQQRFHLLQQLMIGICFREEPLSTQNYRDDPTRVHVPEPQAANSENRLTPYPVFGHRLKAIIVSWGCTRPTSSWWASSRRRHDRRHEFRRLRRRRLLRDRRSAADRSREVESDHGPRGRRTAILCSGSPQRRESEPGPNAPGFRGRRLCGR